MKHMIYRLYFLGFLAICKIHLDFSYGQDCSLTLGIVYKTQTTANKH